MDTIAIPLLSFFMAGVLVYRFRHYLRRKDHREPLTAFVRRVNEEKQLDAVAEDQMLGPSTRIYNLVGLAVLLAIAWATQYEGIRFLLPMYVGVGFFVSRSAADAARPASYDQLGFVARLRYRYFFAWSWPMHLTHRC